MTKEEIFERFDALSKELGSQNKASAATGVSAAVISQLRRGTYAGNSQAMLDKLESYFSVKSEAMDKYSEVKYAEISTSKKVYSTIRYCHINGGFVIVTGDAGVGKTKAVSKYKEDNPDNTVVITANPCGKSAKAVLKLLALNLNVPFRTSSDDMWFSIADKLHDGMVVIVDEAQLLTYQAIETLRSFSDYYDNCGHTLGVALIGNNGIKERIEGKTREIYQQVNNRTWQRPLIQTTDVTLDDIRLLFPLLNPDGKEIKFLHKVAQSVVGIRGAVKLFENAYNNKHYDINSLAEMAKFMRIDLRGVDLNAI